MSDLKQKPAGSASWADVPKAAYMGTREGLQCVVVRPQPSDRTGANLPAGAIGLPFLALESVAMTGVGMAHWMGQFANHDALYAGTFGLTAYDPRGGSWSYWTGTLLRPTYKGPQVGASAAETLYLEVQILLINAEPTT